jgi:uncharacterized metal-binding protein YceD (DUF177 family)
MPVCSRCLCTVKVPVTVTVTAEDFVENYICESVIADLVYLALRKPAWRV